MNQSEFLAMACNLLKRKAREKSRVQRANGFNFACHWLKNWRKTLHPITKRSNGNQSFEKGFAKRHAMFASKSENEVIFQSCNYRRKQRQQRQQQQDHYIFRGGILHEGAVISNLTWIITY